MYAQFLNYNKLINKGIESWNYYYTKLSYILKNKQISLPIIPKTCKHNGHIFYLIFENKTIRNNFINYMRNNNIETPFHYVSIHRSYGGQKYGIARDSMEVT